MKLKTKRMILRELSLKDAEGLAEILNNINVSKWLFYVSNPYLLKTSKERIRNYIKESKKNPREVYRFSIEMVERPGIIGCIVLTDVNTFSGTAEIGYWLNQKYWGRGLMEEASRSFLDFAFKSLKIRKINSYVFTENQGSVNLMKKLGFKLEGKLKEDVRCQANGKIHDVYAYGLLRREWKK